jgi:hypothetical protein
MLGSEFPNLTLEFFQPHTCAIDTKANSSTEQRGTASELSDENARCKSQQQNQAQACASGVAEAIIAIVLVSMSTHQVNIQTATIFKHEVHKASMLFEV